MMLLFSLFYVNNHLWLLIIICYYLWLLMILDDYYWLLLIIDNDWWLFWLLLMIILLCYVSVVCINGDSGPFFWAKYLEN